jgi:PAS domain S-box-containing protein
LASTILFFVWHYQQVKLKQEKMTAEGLRKVNQLKDEILANTSHELRTPLNGIIGLSESLLDGIAGPLLPKVEQNLKMIVSSGLRMINQVNDILDFSKLSKKELKLRQRPLDIKILVDIVIEISKPLARGKDLQFLNQIPANMPPVYADEDMVQQILYNLIGNALKFTEKGSVTITSNLADDFAVIHVVDTGIGIPSDQFDHLFEPFEQVDGSVERSFGGTGLGLAISKKLVEFHQGAIGVESEPGQGSRFWFSLPFASGEVGESHSSDRLSKSRIARLATTWEDGDFGDVVKVQTGDGQTSDKVYRVLVVDDDPINLQVLVNQLSSKKYTISQASDGETALAKIDAAEKADEQFDLVLLDVMMPKMSGYEVCKILRRQYSHNKLPVVMLTAKNQVDDLVAGFESGANDYLPKPFSKDELFARIQSQLTIKEMSEKRLQAEKALRESNRELYNTSQYLEMVIDNANVWLNVLDIQGNVVIWNKAAEEISGYSRDEVIGHNKIWEWSYPDKKYREEIEAKAMDIIRRGEMIENFETTIHRKDNQTRTISWHSRNLTDEDGNPMGSIAFGRDVTSTKLLEEQLAQAQKMEAIGTLASGIAHDFNNLLQAINGYSQILLLKKQVDDPDHNEIKQIYQAGERAAQLVQQLLLFSRKVATKRRRYELNHEVEQIKNILERTIPKMIAIELHLGSRLWPINADPVQIEQILLNLGGNAADAMPEGGRLIIKTENVSLDEDFVQTCPGVEPGNYVLLSVSDTGQGIDEETVAHIFEPFFTTKDIGKGTGLGLASAYGIVKNHGGHITCISEVGRGTTFSIYLPAAELRTESETVKEEPETLVGGSETILLVDDEKLIRDFASQILEKYGYTALTASSGEEALEIYTGSSGAIDLVILDIGMPGMGGYKCLRKIMAADRSAKVVVASGYSLTGEVKATLEVGAAGYIGKPYKVKDLLVAVRAVLDKTDTFVKDSID